MKAFEFCAQSFARFKGQILFHEFQGALQLHDNVNEKRFHRLQLTRQLPRTLPGGYLGLIQSLCFDNILHGFGL